MSCGESCSRRSPCSKKGKSCCNNCASYHFKLNKVEYIQVFVKNKNNEIFKFENCTMEDISKNIPDAELIYLEKDIDIENTFKTDEVEFTGNMLFMKIESDEWIKINKSQSLKEFKISDINERFFEFVNKKFNFNEDVLNEVANELINNNELVKADKYLKLIENKISDNLNELIINKNKNILNLYADVKYKRAIVMSTTPGNQTTALSKMREARDVEKMVNAIVR